MVGLGVVGIVLPVLPTTPFLLLALWFFGRSSERLRHWILNNRVFGGYIRAYRSGRGMPVKMQIWTLVFLWITIGFSTWATGLIWLKISLLVIATAVTVHIIMLGRRRIFVLVPTIEEAKYLDDFVICGVGMPETAATLLKILRRRKPRLVILAGIAGAYVSKDFKNNIKIGDSVIIEHETILSIFEKYNKKYYCPWASNITLPKADGNTVFQTEQRENGIENMEGAVFFAMCSAAGVRFLEVRAISNMTTDRREDWRIDDAAHALGVAVKQIFDEIDA